MTESKLEKIVDYQMIPGVSMTKSNRMRRINCAEAVLYLCRVFRVEYIIWLIAVEG